MPAGLLAGAAGGPVGLAIGAGASILGGLLSRSGPSREEKEVLRNQAEAQKLGMGTARQLLPSGIDSSRKASDYWGNILSGDRASATAAAAPDILRIGEGYDAAARTSTALSPRGGPSAEFLAEQPFQRQRDISLLLGGLRGDAAGKAGSAGSAQIANAIQALYGSSAAGRDILASAENRRQIEAQRGQQIGGALYDLLRGNKDTGAKGLVEQLLNMVRKADSGGVPDYTSAPASTNYAGSFVRP